MYYKETHSIMFKRNGLGLILFGATPFVHSFTNIYWVITKAKKCSKYGVIQVVKKLTNISTFMKTTFFWNVRVILSDEDLKEWFWRKKLWFEISPRA